MAASSSVSWPSELELKLNLNAIKKSDQFVVNIVDMASQVALYKFKSETQAWDKTDVEGALFVYNRSSHPKHAFFIMNRLNMNNINEAITSDMEFKQQDPFLLFRNKKNGIFGIWFYDAQECARLSNLLIRLSTEETSPPKRPISNPEFASKSRGTKDKDQKEEESSGKVDIMSMFAKAQEQYNKRTSEQAEPPEQKPSLQEQHQQFLQQNQQQTDKLKQAITGKEHGKVKQRAYSTPVPYQPPGYPSTPLQFPSITENGLSNNQLPLGYTRNKHATKPQSLSVSKVLSSKGTSDMSPDRSGAQRKLFQGDIQQVTKQQQDSPQKGSDPPSTVSTSLLSPMAFKTLAAKTTTPDPQPKSTPQKLDISPLTQEQLLQAMMYLMKNDSDFIKKLHEAYLKSLHELLPT